MSDQDKRSNAEEEGRKSSSVFKSSTLDKLKTPEWLSKIAEAADQGVAMSSGAIGEDKVSEVLPNLREKKPAPAEVGLDPSSFLSVTPTLEVVTKVDEAVRGKLEEAGFDPDSGKFLKELEAEDYYKAKGVNPKFDQDLRTQEVNALKESVDTSRNASKDEVAVDLKSDSTSNGEKLESDNSNGQTDKTSEDESLDKQEEEKVNAEKNAKKKGSLLKGFSLFNKTAKKHQDTVKKIDQETEKVKGKAKVSQDEKKEYLAAEKIYQEGLAYIRDLIAPSAMEINYDSIRVDGKYAKTFYVYAYPRFLDVNWLSPVINFDVTMDVSQFIYPISSEKILRVLKKKVAQMQSSIRISAEKGRVRDPGIETSLQDAEALRTQIMRGQEKFFQFALYFTVYADDEKDLEKVAKQLESLLAGRLVLTKRAQLQAEAGYNSTIPLALDEIFTIRNMNTGPLSTTFPFTSSDLTSDKGVLYGLNRHNDSLIIFDRFSLENANSVVFAKSGAGKSYAVKLEILRLMMMGTDVIIIDPENEYEALANTVGGSYLRMSLNSDRRINPFDLPKPVEGEFVQAGDILRSNVITLNGLLKLMLGGLTPVEEGILDKALSDVCSLKGMTRECVDASIDEPPTMEDLYNILQSLDGADSIVQRLSKYIDGSYSGIFNKPTNVNLNEGLMVFCVRDLEDALRPIAMYIILNYIWSKVRSSLKKRVLVVDEAWTMMQNEDSAKFLFGLVKRARKYYLGVTTITQDVEDFMKSSYGKPIVTNSSMQLLLKQAPSAADVLVDVFNLTEGEKYVLLNSGVGQGLFFAGQKHVAIQVIASYTEDKIVTTNPEDVLKNRNEMSN